MAKMHGLISLAVVPKRKMNPINALLYYTLWIFVSLTKFTLKLHCAKSNLLHIGALPLLFCLLSKWKQTSP